MALFFLVSVTVAACASEDKGEGAAEPTTAGATAAAIATATAEPPTPTPSISFTNENWGLALSNADEYKGAKCVLTGKVFNLVPAAEGIAFQMWTNPDNSEGNTLVVSADSNLLGTVQKDKYVRVSGFVESSYTYDNVAGGKVTAPKVLAATVDVIGRAEAVAPALKAVQVNVPVTQYGLTITLEKVEMAAGETRAYVKAVNASTGKASLYDFDAVLVQGTKQIKQKMLFGSDYPEIDNELLAGTETSGIIVFEAADVAAGSLKFVWSGPRTDDYRLDFQDWTWEISWQ
jgi:hypothetical protein